MTVGALVVAGAALKLNQGGILVCVPHTSDYCIAVSMRKEEQLTTSDHKKKSPALQGGTNTAKGKPVCHVSIRPNFPGTFVQQINN